MYSHNSNAFQKMPPPKQRRLLNIYVNEILNKGRKTPAQSRAGIYIVKRFKKLRINSVLRPRRTASLCPYTCKGISGICHKHQSYIIHNIGRLAVRWLCGFTPIQHVGTLIFTQALQFCIGLIGARKPKIPMAIDTLLRQS